MIAKTLSAAAVLALAGSASAQFLAPSHTSTGAKIASHDNVTAMSRGTADGSVNIPFVVASWDLEDDASNVVLTFDLAALAGQPSGTAMEMTGLGWNVFQSTVGPSWGQEMTASFEDSAGTPGVYLGPSASAAPIVGVQNNSSGGILDLTDNAIPNIVLADGILQIEFFETYDDVANAIDGNWLAGSSFDIAYKVVPAPGAMGLLGLAGVAALGRKRR